MQRVYSLRAKLVFDKYRSGNCATVVTENIKRYLANSPSLIEKSLCSRRGCVSEKPIHHSIAISLNSIEFENDFKNLKKSILANFPDDKNCKKCSKPLNRLEHTAGNHLFIEVCFL